MVHFILTAAILVTLMSPFYAGDGYAWVFLALIYTTIMWFFKLVGTLGCGGRCKCYAVEKDSFENTRNTESTTKFLQQLRDTEPSLSFTVDCYHYEQRLVEVYEKNGKHHTEYRTETVSSHKETRHVSVVSWYDDTAPLKISSIKGAPLIYLTI